MSQNDLTIANQGFASFRSDLNSALQALGSTNSGNSAPSTTFAHQLWYDASNNILKMRNTANDAFISLFTLDQTNDNIESLTVNGLITSTTLNVTGAITSSAGATITTADNTAQLTLVSTDADASSGPQLTLKRDSSSPADSDFGGRIKFISENDASQEVTYVDLVSRIKDASDGTEDGEFMIKTMVAGSDLTNLRITTNGITSGQPEVVINDDSIDMDFRVESNGNTNMLFVDGGNNLVGLGTNAPLTLLHLQGSEPDIFLRRTDLTNKAWRFNVQSSTGDLNIKSRNDDGSASSTSMIIGHDGSATVSNGLTLTDGNLVVASGHGIDFSAAGNSSGMTSELLDDYEEGTFTPTFGGSSGNPTVSYSTQVGTYVKVGNIVTVTASVVASGTPSGGAGDLQVKGLPFTGKSGVQQAGSVAFTNNLGTASGTTQMGCNIEGGVSFLNVNSHEYSGVSSMTRTEAPAIQNSAPRIVCTICYETA